MKHCRVKDLRSAPAWESAPWRAFAPECLISLFQVMLVCFHFPLADVITAVLLRHLGGTTKLSRSTEAAGFIL